MILGPAHPPEWWDQHAPDGDCFQCGGQCNGEDCGTHAAGCHFGGFADLYWIYSPDCPLFHGDP